MSVNNAFVWVTPAFGGNIPCADHTWVTSYDSRKTELPNLSAVEKSQELYWHCKGSFHVAGKSSRAKLGLALMCSLDKQTATCLVVPNSATESGTIRRYAIDGVCHQVTNQVIAISTTQFLQTLRRNVRGYKLSCIIYGIYGRRRREWYNKRYLCTVTPRLIMPIHSHFMRCLFHYPKLSSVRDSLENARKKLLADIDNIGRIKFHANETNQQRAKELNKRINIYLTESYSIIKEAGTLNHGFVFFQIFGIKPNERIDLIDPELFALPYDNDNRDEIGD